MILDNKRHPRTATFMEFNPEPIEPKNFFNPSIEEMLNNPQCMIQKYTPVYLEDSTDNVPDNWNDDVQNYFSEFDNRKEIKPSSSEKKKDIGDKEPDDNDEQSEEEKVGE